MKHHTMKHPIIRKNLPLLSDCHKNSLNTKPLTGVKVNVRMEYKRFNPLGQNHLIGHHAPCDFEFYC